MSTNELWFENKVQNAARALPYPPTPDLAARVLQQRRTRRPIYAVRLAQVAAALLIAFAILFVTVPEIRAGVLEFLRVGVISIFVGQTPTLSPVPVTPRPTLDFPGETTLGEARNILAAPILLPTYPADLGAPSNVYAFDHMVVLEWLDAAGQNRLSLFMFTSGLQGEKFVPYNPVDVQVNGLPAVWLTDAHDVEIFVEGDERSLRHTVTGNVLIWEQDRLTYRLETHEVLEEAIRIAESLR